MKMTIGVASAACLGAVALMAAAPNAASDASIAPAWSEGVPAVTAAPAAPVTFPGSTTPIDISGTARAATESLSAAAVPSQSTVSDRERNCLAAAVYHEARGEPRAGQIAVARVIINRTKSGRYPSTICGVVYQPAQFSDIKPGAAPGNAAHWRAAQAVADDALQGEGGELQGAMYFHASYVHPGWNRVRVAAIGNHVFYR